MLTRILTRTVRIQTISRQVQVHNLHAQIPILRLPVIVLHHLPIQTAVIHLQEVTHRPDPETIHHHAVQVQAHREEVQDQAAHQEAEVHLEVAAAVVEDHPADAVKF